MQKFRNHAHPTNSSSKIPASVAKLGVTLSTLALFAFLSACSESESEKQRHSQSASAQNGSPTRPVAMNMAQNSRPYEVIIATAGKSQSLISLGATVTPKTQLTIRAQAPGRVVFIAGEEGTELREGQTIVDLDEKNLVAQRRAAEAGLQRAQAQLQNAYIQLDQNIISEGHTSRGGMGMPSMFDQFVTQDFGDMMGVGDSDYDRYASIYQSRTAVEQAKSAVMEAESGLEQIDAMFRDKKALAPADTVILEKMVELGDAVQPGQPLVRIGDVSALEVTVDVPSRLVGSLQEGMPIPVSIDVTRAEVMGKVIRIFPSADAQRHTTRVKIAIPPRTEAAPGMYATVMVPDDNPIYPSSITLPASAIVWRGSQASIYAVDPQGKAELRMIRIGSRVGNRISVLSGVSGGDQIIRNPDSRLRSGDMIQVMMGQRTQGNLRLDTQPPLFDPLRSNSIQMTS